MKKLGIELTIKKKKIRPEINLVSIFPETGNQNHLHIIKYSIKKYFIIIKCLKTLFRKVKQILKLMRK